MVDREKLRRWAEDEERTVRWIAEQLGLSYTATRMRLKRAGIETFRTRRLAGTALPRDHGLPETFAWCPIHGDDARMVTRPDGGFRCVGCRKDAVSKRRRLVKATLVQEAGGACQLCGFSDFVSALQFHHLDPTLKSFSLSARGVTRSLARARAEAAKCALLCTNCHAGVEAGVLQLPSAPPRALQGVDPG